MPAFDIMQVGAIGLARLDMPRLEFGPELADLHIGKRHHLVLTISICLGLLSSAPGIVAPRFSSASTAKARAELMSYTFGITNAQDSELQSGCWKGGKVPLSHVRRPASDGSFEMSIARSRRDQACCLRRSKRIANR